MSKPEKIKQKISDKKNGGSLMKMFKYVASLILFSFLIVIDFLFVVTTISAILGDNRDFGAAVAGAMFSFIFIILTVKCRSYLKKLDTKDAASAPVNIEKTDKSGSTDKVVKKRGNSVGIGCLLFIIPVVAVCAEGWARWFWLAVIIFIILCLTTIRFSKKNAGGQEKGNELKPDYELKYKSADGEVTVRKVFVDDFDGKMLNAYCFLRNEGRTFYVPRIIECVDLETGEVLSNETNGDLRWYFNEKLKKNFKPSDMFEYDEWTEMSFSSCTPFVDDIDGFDVDDDFVMKIVTYKEGFVSGKFHFGKVYSSMYNDGGFYFILNDDDGNRYNVELNKVISVEGVDDIGKYVNEKFLNSNERKARRLQKEFGKEISVFIYLGRADGSSINDRKRNVICNYLNDKGCDCTSEILSIVARRISVDTGDYKKIVNELSKSIDQSNKTLLLASANDIVGGKEKAKPFGLAGLLYLESKIKP